ncbi:MAG: phage terminase large subunit [Candidatus Pacebacteria bacterium]|nr:phage terminase large subunit [Candidatus Paceibacterota bacterium]
MNRNKTTARDQTKDLLAFAAALRRQIEAEVTGFSADPREQVKRIKQVETSFEYFCVTYFPHYLTSPDRSQLHKYLFKRLPEVINSPESHTDAIAAPRGEAKSTLVSQLFVIWCIVTARKHYPVIVMDSLDQAMPMLEAIKAELEFNPRLLLDFPSATGQGRVWQSAVILTKNDVKVQVAGSGKKLRGLRHGPFRPDLCVLDDIENDEQVRSPDQRDKLNSWLTKTVLPLGGPNTKFDVIYIGTILHYDSVLSRVLNNRSWRVARFKALIKWPERMDLWDQWETIKQNDGDEAADQFYDQNRTAMEAGAETSWAARPLLKLMRIRARDGHGTFDSEYQNDPVDGENAPFNNCIFFWVQPKREWIFLGALDPSLGKAGKSRDPSAIGIGALDRLSMEMSIVEAQIKKRLPDRIIEDAITMQIDYKCLAWAVEAVQFQEFLRTELIRRAALRGIAFPARAVTPSTDKLLRIESLQPHMANRKILLHQSQSTLIDQFRHYPMADHDDGPDMVEMLWTLAQNYSRYSGVDGIRRIPRTAGRGFR